MELIPHITVSDAAAFIQFCEKAFGATRGMCMPEPNGKRIMHAEITIGSSKIFLCDEFPEMGGRSATSFGGSPVTLNLGVENADDAMEKAVAAGATVTMPVADQFWGDRYGQFRDPFGNNWALAQAKEKLSPEEIERRAATAM